MKFNRTKLIAGFLSILVFSTEHVSACYDPSTQRWLNRDPIAERGGINLYAFTFNNPVSFVDVFGNDPACSAYTGMGMGMTAEQLTDFSKTGAPAAAVIGLYTVALIASEGGVLPVTGGVLGRILGWLGLGGAAAESPPGQQATQRTPQLINRLLQELRGLEQALWEDRAAVDNARNLIAKYRNMGIEPNPHGLINDLKSFEEAVAAKEKAIQAVNGQLHNLGCQGY
jgi:hypothetical protein